MNWSHIFPAFGVGYTPMLSVQIGWKIVNRDWPVY